VKQGKYTLLPLVLAFWTVTLNAGDEDMSPSAYHVFDPETGYMITVDPMDEEQQVPPVVDEELPAVGPTTPVAWQFWIATLVVATGIVAWLRKSRETHN